jgi:hypothetical protein
MNYHEFPVKPQRFMVTSSLTGPRRDQRHAERRLSCGAVDGEGSGGGAGPSRSSKMGEKCFFVF